MIRLFRGSPRRLFLLPSLVLAAMVFSQTPASALQLTLNWGDTATNEDGFKVERKAGTTGTFAQLATVGANVASYADASVTGGATYCYRVRAYNTAGDSGYSNEACGTASADTQLPSTTITAPANGATVSGTSITVSASATDNVGVVGVQFKLDGVNLGGEDTTAPYSTTWNTTTTPNGSHTLTAVARDAAGNQGASTPVIVTVNNTAPPPPDPNGLVAAYSFDEGSGSTVADASTAANNGAISGATWTTQGKFGSALSFDGVNDWVTVNDAASLDLTIGMTLEAWVYPTSVSGKRDIFLKEGTGVDIYNLYASNWRGSPESNVFVGGSNRTTEGAALAANVWTHIAGTYNGTILRLFLNGVEVASSTVSGSISTSSGPLRIGGNSIWGEFFEGWIDNVRIYNRALTLTEIQANMNTPVGSPPPPPTTSILTIAKVGTGSGTVTSSPAGINCGATCAASYTNGTSVTLTATPAASSTFTGWNGGGCSGTGTCTVMLSAATSVTATFTAAPTTYNLSVTKAGTGSGTVSSSPAGIACGATCSASYTSGTAVTLTASPAAGSSFSGWSGACSGTGTCTVTMSAATAVTATFNVTPPTTYSLSVSRTGTGSGTVTSSPVGINCGATCSSSYSSGTVVTLTASSAVGSAFTGWSGACSGLGSCTVTMSAAQTVTATFNLLTSALTVNKAGTGSGTVTSSPAGIRCGSDCSEAYPNGTLVTLTATPTTGSTFTGWSGGGCSGAGACAITVSAATSVTATFTSQLNVKIGLFRPSTGQWYLDINGNGLLDDCAAGGCIPSFGSQDNLPVVGNWLGNGVIQIGVFDPTTRVWKLDRNANDQWEGCTVDLCFGPIWQSGDLPIVGRWKSGVTKDLLGIYRPSKRYWRLDLNGDGAWSSCTAGDACWSFGNLKGLPVVGDWTGGSTTKLGIFDSTTGQWKLDQNGNGNWDGCTTDRCLGPFGLSGDQPVSGDWNGTGTTKIGTFDPTTGLWELDLNGNGVFDGCSADACLGPFGQQGDLPVIGKW